MGHSSGKGTHIEPVSNPVRQQTINRLLEMDSLPAMSGRLNIQGVMSPIGFAIRSKSAPGVDLT